MITLKQALQDCSTALQSHYCDREAYAISHMLIEHLTQFSKLDVLVHANDMLSEQQMQNYHAALERLQQQEPIQYVLGYAWFMNKQLAVNNAVLIPRPETEELIALIKKHHTSNESLAILEIGTGSGCIAIALKDHFICLKKQLYSPVWQALPTCSTVINKQSKSQSTSILTTF